jgi:hypothetical protein
MSEDFFKKSYSSNGSKRLVGNVDDDDDDVVPLLFSSSFSLFPGDSRYATAQFVFSSIDSTRIPLM